MLAHLNSFDKNIAVGKEYLPGDTCAYVGVSGHETLNHWDPHLHLSYYKRDFDEENDGKKIVYSEGLNINFGSLYNLDFINSRRNPFNHNTEKHKGFGK